MFRTCGLYLLFVVLLCVGPASAGDAKPTKNLYLKDIHRAGSKTLPELLKAELDLARKKKKQVVIMFSADWCSPCKTVKEFLQDSPAVQRMVRKGHILVIDVDEWRGPAHRLIPGVNPTKLPTLVRVDYSGQKVQECYGTSLGLLSGESIGANLARLIDGKQPAAPKYDSDPELKRALMRQSSLRDKGRHKGIPPIEVAVRNVQGDTWTLRIVLRNQEAPRRWFVIPASLDGRLPTKFKAPGFDLLKFSEHVRAQFLRFNGEQAFYAIPVGGHGYVVLDNWVIKGSPQGGELPIWQLNRLLIDGKQAKFDRKLPYALELDKSSQSRLLRRNQDAVDVELVPRKQHTLPLDPI
jgi:thiol-disulfide isomerase/thioredoxin